MDVTLRFYDACDMKMFREHSYYNMKEISLSFIKDVVERSLNAFIISIPYLVTKQFVSDDEFVFNIILDGSSIPSVFGETALDDLSLTINSVILWHCS